MGADVIGSSSSIVAAVGAGTHHQGVRALHIERVMEQAIKDAIADGLALDSPLIRDRMLAARAALIDS